MKVETKENNRHKANHQINFENRNQLQEQKRIWGLEALKVYSHALLKQITSWFKTYLEYMYLRNSYHILLKRWENHIFSLYYTPFIRIKRLINWLSDQQVSPD